MHTGSKCGAFTQVWDTYAWDVPHIKTCVSLLYCSLSQHRPGVRSSHVLVVVDVLVLLQYV